MSSRFKCFVDTNIFVYAYDTTAGLKHEKAKDLLKRLWQEDSGCISVQVLQEFYVATSKKVKIPLPAIRTKTLLSDLIQWRTYSPIGQDILDTIAIKDRYKISFWDAMIVLSASRLDCTILYTEDLNNHQSYEEVEAVNPFI